MHIPPIDPFFPIPHLVPNWPVPSTVHACFTLRGSSPLLANAFGSFNVALHVGDDAVQVRQNRMKLEWHMGASVLWLHQTHTTHVVEADMPFQDRTPDADGVTTTKFDLACCVMVADCLPILLCDLKTHRIAALHAGWRGLCGSQGIGIIEAYICQHYPKLGERRSILAWLGPCIGPTAFQVGGEVRQAFVEPDFETHAFFRDLSGEKYLGDLSGIARHRLHKLGITQLYGNDGSNSWCTASHPDHYYSYRKDGITGRHAALIWQTSH